MTGNKGQKAVSVLVVEDELAIQRGVCDVLAFHGYQPEGVLRGDDGLRRALEGEHALLVLDIMLPGLDGFEICRRVRAERPALPILMLTARGSEEDVLRGFRAGSDDYVTKPFSIAELVARVEALLRRAGSQQEEGEDDAPFDFGPWRIDPETLQAHRDGEEVALVRRDLEVARLFVREAGRIVSRRLLLREIWGYPDPARVETRSVDMQIVKLRRKLGAAVIETVRGEGYRYTGCVGSD